MANNRMYLVNTRTDQKILLAKYWPSEGWSPFVAYTDGTTSAQQYADFWSKFQMFFSDNDGDPSQNGPLDYKIAYEHQKDGT